MGFYPDEAQARMVAAGMPYPMAELTIGTTKRFEFRVNGQLAETYDDKQAAELGAQAWLERFNSRAREFGTSPMGTEHTELVDTGERPPSAAIAPAGTGAPQPPATTSPAAPPPVPHGQVIPTAEARPATGGAAMAPASGAQPMHTPHPPLNVGPVPHPDSVSESRDSPVSTNPTWSLTKSESPKPLKIESWQSHEKRSADRRPFQASDFSGQDSA